MNINCRGELLHFLIFACCFKEHLGKQYEKEYNLVSYHGRFFYTLFIAVVVKGNAYFLFCKVVSKLLLTQKKCFLYYNSVGITINILMKEYSSFLMKEYSQKKYAPDSSFRLHLWILNLICSRLDDHLHIFYRCVLGFRMRILVITCW